MGQVDGLIKTLKGILKSKGMTYKDLGEKLDLSEITIKRMFSKQSITLDRLEKICKVVGVDLYDLALMAKKDSQERHNRLTLHQETQLARDDRLFGLFLLLVNGWTLQTILSTFGLPKAELEQMLVKLDKLKILELYPNNRFRLLVGNNITWDLKGPVWQRYHEEFIGDCLRYDFQEPLDRVAFTPALMSPASVKTIAARLDALVREFNELAELDSSLPPKSRTTYALIFGFRPWVISAVKNLREKPGAADFGMLPED